MGGHYDSMMIRATTEEELQKKWREFIKQEEYEHGHGAYSGTLATCSGLKILEHRKFKTRRKSDEWLEDRVEKREQAIAVRCVEKPKGKMWDGQKKVDHKRGYWWVIGGMCAS